MKNIKEFHPLLLASLSSRELVLCKEFVARSRLESHPRRSRKHSTVRRKYSERRKCRKWTYVSFRRPIAPKNNKTALQRLPQSILKF